jgi:FdhD protein
LSTQENAKPFAVLRRTGKGSEAGSLELLGEEPLQVRVEDKPYAVVMRTPGEEREQAAGFCLGEGIIDGPDDLRTIGYDWQQDPNLIDVWLKPARRARVKGILRRRSFVSQTSCGICGKGLIADLQQKIPPVTADFSLGLGQALACLARLSANQVLHKATRAAHAALLIDEQLRDLAFAEDVGRHNALDKAIGRALLGGTLGRARLLVLSSRTSYELVQKAARARIQILISNSRPTTLAAEMAAALNLTLAFPAAAGELVIVCGDGRIGRDGGGGRA